MSQYHKSGRLGVLFCNVKANQNLQQLQAAADLETSCVCALPWGMRVETHSAVASISESSTDLKRIKLHTVYLRIFEQIKPLQLVSPEAEFKFESTLEPLVVIW